MLGNIFFNCNTILKGVNLAVVTNILVISTNRTIQHFHDYVIDNLNLKLSD